MSEGVAHIVGLAVNFGPLRRQRCAWCGQLLQDDDLRNMAWPLNEDGTDPGPPPMWREGGVVVVQGDLDSFRIMHVIEEDDLPDHPDGGKRLPDNACVHLDPEVTR